MLDWLMGSGDERGMGGEAAEEDQPMDRRAVGFAPQKPKKQQAAAFVSAGNTFAALNAGTPEGFSIFAEQFGEALQMYTTLRDETLCLRHLAANEALLSVATSLSDNATVLEVARVLGDATRALEQLNAPSPQLSAAWVAAQP